MRRIGEGLACAISLTIDQTFCLAVSITPPMLPELSTQKTMSMCGRAISGTLTYGGLSKFGRFSSRSLPKAVGAAGHAADANTPATSEQAHFAVHVRFMIPPSVSRFASVRRKPPREVSARRGGAVSELSIPFPRDGGGSRAVTGGRRKGNRDEDPAREPAVPDDLLQLRRRPSDPARPADGRRPADRRGA